MRNRHPYFVGVGGAFFSWAVTPLCADPFDSDPGHAGEDGQRGFARYAPDALLRDDKLCGLVATALESLQAYWFRYSVVHSYACPTRASAHEGHSG